MSGHVLGRRRLPLTVVLLSATALVSSMVTAVPAAAIASPQMRDGRHAGPIAIAGTSAGSRVAKLVLPNGNWTVFATGVVGNRTGSPHTATCTLVAGTQKDRASMRPAAKGIAASRQAFLLTTGVHLVAGVTARVSCAAPSAASGALVAQGLRMWAVNTGSLRIESNAGPITYGVPNDPYLAVSHIVGGFVGLNTSEATVAIFTVPQTGSWAITAKATAYASNSTPGTVTCSLSAGDLDRTQVHVNGKGQAADRQPLALQIVHQFAATGPTALSCGSASGSSIRLKDMHITAYRVSDLTNQDLSSTVTYALPGAAPAVDAGYRDGPITMPQNTLTHLAEQSLPVGVYHVVAKAYLDNDANTSTAPITCTLGSPTSPDRIQLVLGTSTDAVQPIALMGTDTLSARTIVSLDCRTSLVGVKVRWIKLTAYRGAGLRYSGD